MGLSYIWTGADLLCHACCDGVGVLYHQFVLPIPGYVVQSLGDTAGNIAVPPVWEGSVTAIVFDGVGKGSGKAVLVKGHRTSVGQNIIFMVLGPLALVETGSSNSTNRQKILLMSLFLYYHNRQSNSKRGTLC